MSRASLSLTLCSLLMILGVALMWRELPNESIDSRWVEEPAQEEEQIVRFGPGPIEAPVLEPGAKDVDAAPEAPPSAGEKEKKKDKEKGDGKKDPSDKLFSPGMVPRFTITIDSKGWRALEQNAREYVEATVEVDGKTYERVGVHLKGAAGSFRAVSQNPALTLKFNEFVPDQKFHGLRKIHLNNSVQDRSYLNELLAGELFLAAGVPAARATQARVVLNRRQLGLYVLKEGFDKRFLRRHFKDDSGNLYDGGFCQDIFQHLENDTHRDSHDQSDLRRLTDVAQEPDLEERWRLLGQVLDLERFLSLMALEVLLWDWDGYPMKPNNYRVYHDPSTDRLVFIPHGMDQLFSSPEGPILPGMGGIVARAIVETPIGKAKYFERLREMLEKVYLPDVLDQRIREVRSRLVPQAGLLGGGRESAIAQNMEMVRASIRQRARSVERQLLQKPSRPLALDEKGTASLASQRWYPEKDVGGVEATEESGADGAPQLVVDSHGVRCMGSWRCRALLPPGSYKLRARVKTEGVVPFSDKKGAGAGLRLGGIQTPRRSQAVGDSDWRWIEEHFEVRSSLEEVELVCELRANAGRALFDRKSLAVVRVE